MPIPKPRRRLLGADGLTFLSLDQFQLADFLDFSSDDDLDITDDDETQLYDDNFTYDFDSDSGDSNDLPAELRINYGGMMAALERLHLNQAPEAAHGSANSVEEHPRQYRDVLTGASGLDSRHSGHVDGVASGLPELSVPNTDSSNRPGMHDPRTVRPDWPSTSTIGAAPVMVASDNAGWQEVTSHRGRPRLNGS